MQEVAKRSKTIQKPSQNNYIQIFNNSVRKSNLQFECDSETYVTVACDLSGLGKKVRQTFGPIGATEERGLQPHSELSATPEVFIDAKSSSAAVTALDTVPKRSPCSKPMGETPEHAYNFEVSPLPFSLMATPLAAETTSINQDIVHEPTKEEQQNAMKNAIAIQELPAPDPQTIAIAQQEFLFKQMEELQAELKSKEGELAHRSHQAAEETNRVKELQTELEQEKGKSMVQRQSIEGLSESISLLEKQMEVYEEQRKQMHRYIQQLRGNIRVFCRVRPMMVSNKQNNGLG